MCAEVADSEAAFGADNYVGHDEPMVQFHSTVPGSGNRARYNLTVPSDPGGAFSTSKSYNFELHPAPWFGMALCDTQSYPEQVKTCTPDSDANIPHPETSANFPGSAFMELQFYPPGDVPQFAGFSCDATKWCAALTIDSLSEDPVAGKDLNPTCASHVLGGVEYVNFAYVTKSGKPQGPPDPLHFDFFQSGHPGPDVLYMNQGDNVTVTMNDSAHGLAVQLNDVTSGETGTMVASAANGYGQIKYAPRGSTCKEIPYDFHPMYSTSTPDTIIGWAAHTNNVAFSDEIGHFDFCSHIDANTGSCDGMEGASGDQEPADFDDNGCFGSESTLKYPVTGCLDSNVGFDGPSYLHRWPNGSSSRPTPLTFSGPKTGQSFHTDYASSAFESDIPLVEFQATGTCDVFSGDGCTIVPPTDDGAPANFYPYFTATGQSPNCAWQFGQVAGNDFGRQSQYGTLFPSTFLAFGGHGQTITAALNYQKSFAKNPCTS
jgi:hypothetical protein